MKPETTNPEAKTQSGVEKEQEKINVSGMSDQGNEPVHVAPKKIGQVSETGKQKEESPRIKRSTPVVISPSFRDMQRERELLVKKVLPELRWIKNERVVLLKDVCHRQENAPAGYRSMEKCGIKPKNPYG